MAASSDTLGLPTGPHVERNVRIDIVYRKTQVSWPTLVPMALTVLVIGGVFLSTHLIFPLALGAAVVAPILLLFGTMTVIVDDEAVEARMGIGIIRKRVPFTRIRACRVVRNPWYYGWGIHFIPGGILYNASGLSAVELQMTSGRLVRIGSGEPDLVAAALRHAAPGTAQDIDSASVPNMIAVPLIIAAVFAVVVFMIYTGMQPPAVNVTADSFRVGNGPYSDTIPLGRIRSASLDERIPRVGLKINGFNNGGTLRGSFIVDTWGRARLYVNLNHPPFVVLQSDDGFVAVNFVDPQQTRDTYARLRQALDRRR
jgi:hypothetical protein